MLFAGREVRIARNYALGLYSRPRQDTDRPKPVNYILFFFLLKFEIFWEILLQAPPYVCCGRIRVDEARDWLQNQTNKTLQHDF